jgi:hypothetical protein
MLWLIVILLIAALSFVLFHKPHVNAMGAGWVPPEQRTPMPPIETSNASDTPATEDGVTAPMSKQPPQTPDTFDFNDLFGGGKQGPTDHPHA